MPFTTRVRWTLLFVGTLLIAGAAGIAQRPPQRSPHLAPPDQVVAVRAGRLFDAPTGTMRTDHVILVRGDRIVDVGPALQIPAEARVIDLRNASVLPGMIDAHVHNAGRVESPDAKTLEMVQSAERDLVAGFTTTIDTDSRAALAPSRKASLATSLPCPGIR